MMDANSEPTSNFKHTDSPAEKSTTSSTRAQVVRFDGGSIVFDVETTYLLRSPRRASLNLGGLSEHVLRPERGQEIEWCPSVRLPEIFVDWAYALVAWYDASYV